MRGSLSTFSFQQIRIVKLIKQKLKTYGHTSFEFQTGIILRVSVTSANILTATCFGHICKHPHGQENHTQKYINMVLIMV